MVPQGYKGQQAPQETLAHRAPQEIKDKRDRKEQLVPPEHKAHKEILVVRVILAQQEHKEQQDHKVL